MEDSIRLSKEMELRLIKAALRRIGENCASLAEPDADILSGTAHQLMVATLELMALVASYFIDK